jgi:DNA-binding transcriptional ArsR family regulator
MGSTPDVGSHVALPHLRKPRQLRTCWGTHVSMDVLLHALSDPHRRTMLESLSHGPATAGELAALLPIARPGASRHLRVLRESGLVEVRQDSRERSYSLRVEPLQQLDRWLEDYRSLWEHRLDSLHTEIARGTKQRRTNR